MKECFGLHFGFIGGDTVIPEDEREKCYKCEDFDRCYKVAMVRSLNNLKIEIRTGVRKLRNSMGGSHKEYPFG